MVWTHNAMFCHCYPQEMSVMTTISTIEHCDVTASFTICSDIG